MPLRIFLVVLLLWVSTGSFSQEITPIDTVDLGKREILIEKYNTEFESFNKSLRKNYPKRIANEMTDMYTFMQEGFINSLKNKNIVFDERFTNYTNHITDSVTQKIKAIYQNEFKLLVSYSNDVNAFCMPDGSIVLHMGLFQYLENEGQLLAVICHEIAHHHLKHSLYTIEEKANISTSNELQARVKFIKKSNYNQNSNAFGMLSNLLYAEGKKRRNQEIEADSAGYVLFRRVGGKPEDYINSLKFIRDVDSLPTIEIMPEDYTLLFNFPNQPFNEDWLKQEDYSKYNYESYKEKISLDSLKSHPETIERIEKLQLLFPELKTDKKSMEKKEGTFNHLKLLAKQENGYNYYRIQKYASAIYVAMNRILKNPEDTYSRELIGLGFDKLYHAKKLYKFNRYVPYVIPEMEDPSYRQFLFFLWNLKLGEIRIIADSYLSPN